MSGSAVLSNPSPRRVRVPYTVEYIDCTCNAVGKDDCRCIRAWLDARDGGTRVGSARMVRAPYSTQFIPCTCDAVRKDDCRCIRAFLDARQHAA